MGVAILSRSLVVQTTLGGSNRENLVHPYFFPVAKAPPHLSVTVSAHAHTLLAMRLLMVYNTFAYLAATTHRLRRARQMPTRSQARRHTRGAQSGRAARDVTNESAASKALRVIHVWRAWYSATASAAPSAVAKLPRWCLPPPPPEARALPLETRASKRRPERETPT